MKDKIHLILTEDRMTVAPSNQDVESYLTIEEKFLEQDPRNPRIQRTRKRKRNVFRVLKESPRAIQTMQGFWKGLREHLLRKGYLVKIDDLREPFPKPRLDLMHGFRLNQEQLLTSFLEADYSGLLGAPTRYGKTVLIINTIRAYTGLTTVITAPGKDLVSQLYDTIKNCMPQREVKMIGAGSRTRYPSEDITVISMDSIDKADYGRTRLLLIDEPHAAVTNSRLPALNAFTHARRLGYGATLKGRYDGRDALITGLIGPVIAERTYKEAVQEGAICPLIVYMIRVPVRKRNVVTSWQRNRAYKELLFKSDKMANLINRICHELLPNDWQTIMFIRNEEQADFYLEYIGQEGTIAMAKKLTNKQRDELLESMKQDNVKRCLASDIYAQGITFNHVRAMINIAGGGNNTMTIQKPGRLAEIRPNKSAGFIFDFMFYPADGLTYENCGSGVKMLFLDSKNRLKAYEEKGYEIVTVDSYEELEQEFQIANT